MEASTETKNYFTTPEQAAKYISFLESSDGKFQQQILTEAIQKRLPEPTTTQVLDAACGTGWLANVLMQNGYAVEGWDQSAPLLKYARSNYKNITFATADLTASLPYQQNQFNVVVLNMAAQDVSSLSNLYKNMYKVLAAQGTLLVTIPNPFYAFPLGAWKRGIIGTLFGRKPKLTYHPLGYNKKPDPTRPVATFPRSLSAYINTAAENQFVLTHFEELKSNTDSPTFNLQYRLFRYPLMLLMEFKKNSSISPIE